MLAAPIVASPAGAPPNPDPSGELSRLVEGANAGDEAALGVLAERVWAAAYRVASTRYGLGWSDAEDIAQDTVLGLLRRLPLPTINVTWIARGAEFRCLDFLRHRRTEGAVLDVLAREPGRRRERVLRDPLGRWTEIRLAAERLPPRCRALLAAYFREGRTWREIDEALALGRRTAQYETMKCVARLAALVGAD